MNRQAHPIADEKSSIAAIYENAGIADSYLNKRLRFSWQRLLHERQVLALNKILDARRPRRVLEVAPGPARLAVELNGVNSGVMVENSREMISIAAERLRSRGLDGKWKIVEGDAFDLARLLPSGEFDFAYTFRFLRHFRDGERQRLYGLLRNSLKPGALLVFDVVNAKTLASIEAPRAGDSQDEISIYDVGYSAAEFADEMARNGFVVRDLIPLVRHFRIQAFISHKLDNVLPGFSTALVKLAERVPSKAPLEWFAVCEKR